MLAYFEEIMASKAEIGLPSPAADLSLLAFESAKKKTKVVVKKEDEKKSAKPIKENSLP
jgi:hypothetical protein